MSDKWDEVVRKDSLVFLVWKTLKKFESAKLILRHFY